MKTSLEKNFLQELFSKYSVAGKKNSIPERISRQPVHVVYGGADKFKSDTIFKLGRIALRALDQYADNYRTFFEEALEQPLSTISENIYERIINKLKNEPVEDFRIDFEDGYGIRSDKEEDKAAEFTAIETAKGFSENSLPPFFGIRIKPFMHEFRGRAARTLDIYLSTLLNETNGKLPNNFLVTLPKITSPLEITALTELLIKLEEVNSLPHGSIKLEMMIETPEVIINEKGEFVLPSLIQASEGRCFAAHFGAYDFTSSMDITANHQSLDHHLCDFIRNIMKIAFSGSGIFISDGATNILPVPKFRNENLSDEEIRINRESIYKAWRVSYKDINHSLHSGFYQGWDLHPAQIPVRLAAVYTFFLEEFETASKRLKNFINKAAQVSLSENIFDDTASARALLNFFVRGFNCGAFTKDEIKQTGLTEEEILMKSFNKIFELRKNR